jgi:hypothetical protein
LRTEDLAAEVVSDSSGEVVGAVSPRSKRTVVVLVTMAMALLVVGGLWVLPINVLAVVKVASTSTISVSDGVPPLDVGTGLDDMRIEVTALDDRGVQLAMPAPTGGRRLTIGELRENSGWTTWTSGDDRIETAVSGSRFVLEGGFRGVDLPFVTGPGAGRVEVRAGEVSEVVDLAAPESGFRTVRVSGTRREYVATTRFALRSHSFSFPGEAAEAPTAWAGTIDVTSVWTQDPLAVRVDVDRSAVLRAVTGAAVRAALVALVALAILIVALVAGQALGLLLRLPEHPVLGRSVALLLVVGGALPLVAIGALNYVLPARTAVWLVGGTLAVVIVLMGVRGGWRGLAPAVPSRPADWLAGALVFLAVLGPLLVSNGMALGYLQTDAYLYNANVGTFWTESALGSGSDFGTGLRLIDFTARSVVAGLSPLDGAAGTYALRIALLLAVVFALGEVAELLALRGARRVIAVSGASLTAPLLGLWAEAYFSREFFVTTLLICLAATAVVLTAPVNRRLWVVVGAGLAVPMAGVPGFMTIVPATLLCLAPLGSLRRGVRHSWHQRREQWMATLAYLGGLAAAVVPNLVWMRRPDITAQHAAFVSDIGRYVVVPFHASATFPATLAGLLPFHNHRSAWLTGYTGDWVPGPFRQLRDLIDGPTSTVLAVGLFSLVLVSALVAAWIHSRRGPSAERATVRLVLAVVAVTLIGFLPHLALWSKQSYLVLMYAWTLAPVVVAGLVLVLAWLSRRAVSKVAWAWGFALVAVVAVNVNSLVLESSRWAEHPAGPLAPKWHYALAPELAAVQRLADGLDLAGTEVEIKVVPSEPFLGDGWRVLANWTEQYFAERGATCVTCVVNPRLRTIDSLKEAPPPSGRRTTIVIGTQECAGEPRLRTAHLAVCTNWVS